MCGRFYIESDIDDIINDFNTVKVNNTALIKGEVFPGTNIPVVLKNKFKELAFLRWGFKIKGLGREVINARIETVNEKPAFKKAFESKRCIIPANAFFEWETIEKSKIKYKISISDRSLFAMAGLYETFLDNHGDPYTGVVILTRPANEAMSRLHHRMPVFISKNEEEMWLSKDSYDVEVMQKKLQESDWFNLKIEPAEGTRQLSIYDMM